MNFTCSKCDKTWGGYLTSHCGADGCHQTFTGITAFDAHRTGSFTTSGEKTVDKDETEPRGPRRCLPPAEVGLVEAERAYPCWGFPKSDETWWKDDSD